MNYKISVLVLLSLLIFASTTRGYTNPPAISANSAVLMDAKTGEVLYDRNMHKPSPPASTTKILTAILAIESGHLDDQVKVSARAAATGGSSMHLHVGQIITLRELVIGLLLRSGNDAAVAIAEHIAGSVEAFADIMNSKAQALGAYNTRFLNPHGLTTPGHYSTAFDLAWISRYALNNPIFAEIVNTKETSIKWLDKSGKGQERTLRNTNKLLWMLEEADGIKTGTTNAAGPCLVSSATNENQQLIAVVLHDHSRWYDSIQLFKYGFNNFELYDFANQGAVLAVIPVERGLNNNVDAIISVPAALITSAEDHSHITVEVDLPEKIKAPVYQGQKIGEIIFFVRDKAVKTVDIIAAQSIEERTLRRFFFNQLIGTFRLLSGWGVL